MNCKECGIDLTDSKYKMVAEWPFCDKCFKILMAKPRPTEPTIDTTPESQVPVSSQVFCNICEKEIQEGDCRETLGIKLCHQCHQNLIQRPVTPKPAIREEEIDELTKPKVEQHRVDVRQTTNCNECRRLVPTLGTKEFNGKKYCPDCYHTLPEIVAKETIYFPNKVGKVGTAKTTITVSQCMACQRPTPIEVLKKIEGFELCPDCFETDPKAAVQIARARHQKAMAAMQKELNE